MDQFISLFFQGQLHLPLVRGAIVAVGMVHHLRHRYVVGPAVAVAVVDLRSETTPTVLPSIAYAVRRVGGNVVVVRLDDLRARKARAGEEQGTEGSQQHDGEFARGARQRAAHLLVPASVHPHDGVE